MENEFTLKECVETFKEWSFEEKRDAINDLLAYEDYDFNNGLIYDINDRDTLADIFGIDIDMSLIHTFIEDVGLNEYWYENENPIVAYTENGISDKNFLTEEEAEQLCDNILEDVLSEDDGFKECLIDWFNANVDKNYGVQN